MNLFEEKIYEKVLKEVKFYDNEFILDDLEHKDKYKYTFNFINSIVSNVGCNDYLFILLITKLEEKYGKVYTPYLWEILDNYYHYDTIFNKDIAFGAFYNLVLHYYRQSDIDKLKNLISSNPYYKMFYKDYPLVYEAIARYCNIRRLYDRQMIISKCALKELEKFSKRPIEDRTCVSGYIQTGDNVALKVSYVSGNCLILEHCFLRGKMLVKNNDSNILESINYGSISPSKIDEIINPTIKLEYDMSMIENTNFDETISFINDAIAYNDKYPKYYYLKAQLMFYSCIFLRQELTIKLRDQIINLAEKAKSLENPQAGDYDKRCSKYESFITTIKEWSTNDIIADEEDANMHYERLKDDIIQASSCPVQQYRPQINLVNDNNEYVFISYSTKDFKQVYCDIIEMQKRRIQYWYDVGTIPGERWEEVIEERIKQCSCVICYLSFNFFTSGAILKELKLISKYKKPIICIDLTGKKQIAKILIDVIKNSNDKDIQTINSDTFKISTELFNDDIDVITREKDPTVIAHMSRVEKVISSKYKNIICNITSASGIWSNTKKIVNNGIEFSKPNEDYYINDDNMHIYIVVDGISRKSVEYTDSSTSIAFDISKVFADKTHQLIKEGLKYCRNKYMVEELLKQSFIEANEEVRKYLDSNMDVWKGTETPGCVGIVCVIYNQYVCFGTFGDCMGMLIRNNHTQIFADKQTIFPFEKLHIEKDRQKLMSYYVNKPENKYGYGVANGNESAKYFYRVSHISLEQGDCIYIVSDGISDLIQFTDAKTINNMTLEELYSSSMELDKELGYKYSDDKTIIKINIG